MLINGEPGNTISIRDRGLLYGDGVFRTFPARNGIALHWPLHYCKLQHDCAALKIACPDFESLTSELQSLSNAQPDSILKIIVTRGMSQRGYAPDPHAVPTHIWDASPMPVYPDDWKTSGVTLRLCQLRLGHQPLLAGIKHLNRLENVMAAAELANLDAAEGLLLDTENHVIEGTRSNVFLISKDRLITPDLSRCGVAGVQRDRVMSYAKEQGMAVEVRDVELNELRAADELFLTNSMFGLLSVSQFEERRWMDFGHAVKIRAWLEGADHG